MLATVNADADGPAAGAAFGTAFFLAIYGIIGPALSVTPLPWQQSLLRVGQHLMAYVLFGLSKT
jgi:hypothetical protein